MKRLLVLILFVALALAGCAQATTAPATTKAKLTISGGTTSKSYALADLQKLAATKASFKGVEYVGVQVSTLLKDAGFDLSQVKAVKAVASDGFTVNYDSSLFNKEDTLVAYARSDGAPMTSDDGNFRMVLPDQEGKMNARQVVEIQVIQ